MSVSKILRSFDIGLVCKKKISNFFKISFVNYWFRSLFTSIARAYSPVAIMNERELSACSFDTTIHYANAHAMYVTQRQKSSGKHACGSNI